MYMLGIVFEIASNSKFTFFKFPILRFNVQREDWCTDSVNIFKLSMMSQGVCR